MQLSERLGRRINLRPLHILRRVVQSGSMSKAAKSLAISTPVVSKTIADLEHSIGVRLLDRSAGVSRPRCMAGRHAAMEHGGVRRPAARASRRLSFWPTQRR